MKPEEMNEFIKNLMDPFNNCVTQSASDFDTYYEEYYKLYDIKNPDLIDSTPHISGYEYNFKKMMNPFSTNKNKNK